MRLKPFFAQFVLFSHKISPGLQLVTTSTKLQANFWLFENVIKFLLRLGRKTLGPFLWKQNVSHDRCCIAAPFSSYGVQPLGDPDRPDRTKVGMNGQCRCQMFDLRRGRHCSYYDGKKIWIRSWSKISMVTTMTMPWIYSWLLTRKRQRQWTRPWLSVLYDLVEFEGHVSSCVADPDPRPTKIEKR